MPSPIVVFDLDGTLVDSAPDLVDTLNAILAREKVPPVPFETARDMIGSGARVLLERGLSSAGRTDLHVKLDGLMTDYIEHYAAHIADRSQPFPGLGACLDRLASQGFLLAVCTNKLEWLSLKLLDALSLTSRFAAICGQDTFGVQKPDPEILRRTIAKAGGALQRAVMVGDSATDVNAAKAAGIPVIAVNFGYTPVPVQALSPDRIIDHFDQLPHAVSELLAPDNRPAGIR
jgi:phosphoglycolate phosphatase